MHAPINKSINEWELRGTKKRERGREGSPYLDGIDFFGIRNEGTLLRSSTFGLLQPVGEVVHGGGAYPVSHVSIALVVEHGANWSVDGQICR